MSKLKPDPIFVDPAHLKYSVNYNDGKWWAVVMTPGGKIPFAGEMMEVHIIQERSELPSWLHPIPSRYR